ncbi:MAG TPA: rRNA maturation RNase YbeY [Cyclobacteriaceae bacterium]|nr:rRNA maturation RNase YbeY [Cyclobacteriaceae bacterium]
MAIINFFNEDIRFRLSHKKKIRIWVEKIFRAEFSKHLTFINFIFCSDTYLLKINRAYLNKNTLTDVITFNLSEDRQSVEGEVYISIDRVRENGIILKIPIQKELYRVIIHGILHLNDYRDDDLKGKKRMQRLENKYLKYTNI